ncbi:MAG: hypothetical protein QM796_11740 [Chthoniobacteraceae bacterium]
MMPGADGLEKIFSFPRTQAPAWARTKVCRGSGLARVSAGRGWSLAEIGITKLELGYEVETRRAKLPASISKAPPSSRTVTVTANTAPTNPDLSGTFTVFSSWLDDRLPRSWPERVFADFTSATCLISFALNSALASSVAQLWRFDHL